MRKCCSSFKSISQSSSGNNCETPPRDKLLLDQTKYTVVSRKPPSNEIKFGVSSVRLTDSKKGSVQEVQQLLRSKFNRLQSGLKKRRALSVQEVFTGSQQHPTFYVPSPLDCDRVPSHDFKSLPDYEDNDKTKDCDFSRYRIVHSCSIDVIQNKCRLGSDFGYHSIESHASGESRDEIDRSVSFRSVKEGINGLKENPPEEPPPDYDDDLKNVSMRRWSVTNGLAYRHLSRFENTDFRVGHGSKVNSYSDNNWDEPQNGPPSLPYEESKPKSPMTKRRLPKICVFGKTRERTRSHSPSSRNKHLVKDNKVEHKIQSSISHYNFNDKKQGEVNNGGRVTYQVSVHIIHLFPAFVISYYSDFPRGRIYAYYYSYTRDNNTIYIF